MNRSHVSRVLLVAAGVMLASAAAAQNPHAAEPAKANAAPEAKKADDKKVDDKKVDDKAQAKPLAAEDRETRKAKQHADEKAKLEKLLKAPMDDATKQEERRHAERIARLERIKALATDAKDTDALARVTKLEDKENARHDKWMGEHANGGAK